jgi:excisionase family DNA binding protein
MPKEYYSPTEAAEVLGVRREHIVHLIKSGKLIASNVGIGQRTIYRISIEEINNYLKKSKIKPDEQPRSPEN